jgi:hypothetical protein
LVIWLGPCLTQFSKSIFNRHNSVFHLRKPHLSYGGVSGRTGGMSLGIFNPLKAFIGTVQGLQKKGFWESLKLLYTVCSFSSPLHSLLTSSIWNHLSQVGDFKFGELRGQDAFGNKYYEVSFSLSLSLSLSSLSVLVEFGAPLWSASLG